MISVMLITMRLLALLLALPAFAQQPLDRAWTILGDALQDKNPVKRVQDVAAMGILKPQARPVTLVESAFEDTDYSVRQAACAALEQMKARQSITKLHEMLNDKAPEVVFAAAKALYSMNDPTGRQVLVAVLLGDRADASGFFSSSMHDMKQKIHDPKGLILVGVKEGAGFALGPASAGIPVAEGLMKDSNASGKTVAVALLAKNTNPEILEALRDALEDRNWTVRAAAARALAVNDRYETLKQIAGLMDDKREEVRYSAAAAVIRLKQTPVRPAAHAKK